MQRTPWQDRLVVVAAVWLVAAPFVLGPRVLTHPATVSDFVCAAMLVSSAADAPPIPDVLEEWVILIVGLGFMASPWLLEYTDERNATVNALAVGGLVALCALSALVTRSFLVHRGASREQPPA